MRDDSAPFSRTTLVGTVSAMEQNPVRGQRLGQADAQILVEAAQRQRLAVDEMRLGAEPGEHAGEFHADIAAADDGDALGHLFQIERIVGDDAEFRARNVQPGGMAAGGDDDALGGDALAADIERVLVDESCPRVENLRTGLVEQTAHRCR